MSVNYDSSQTLSNFENLKNFKKIGQVKFDLDAMRNFLQAIPEDLWDPVTHQICFTHTEFNYEDKPKLHFEGCGSLTYQWSLHPYDNKKELKKRTRKLYERDFSTFNRNFFDTPVHTLYENLRPIFKMGRVRLIALDPKKCMSWHSDDEIRLHFAINTEASCRMVIGEEAAHIPADGHGYLCNTRIFHTALNGSHKCHRVHLVIGVVDTDFSEI